MSLCAFQTNLPTCEKVFGSLSKRARSRRGKLSSLKEGISVNFLGRLTLGSSVILTLAVPALAGVTVDSPVNNTDVSSPFTLSASASTCSSQNVASMGYSFDSSSDTAIFYQQSIDASVAASTGAHTLHVKAWGDNGASCVTDVAVTIKSSATSVIPSTADPVSSIQSLGGWQMAHDSGTPGASSGYMTLVTSPSLYGSSRQFVTDFTDNGGERYSLSFSDNVDAENFFYDGWIYLTSSASNLANLEFDINQTMPNGQTVLTGVQCSGWSGAWQYTANEGSANSPKPTWVTKSGTSCNPQKWSQNTWHHVQAYTSRDSSGSVTYHSVWLDGVEIPLNATVNGAADLGWGPVVNTQFQVDGDGSSGHVTAYLDELQISMW